MPVFNNDSTTRGKGLVNKDLLVREWRFTEVLRAHETAHPYERESVCLREHLKNGFEPIEVGDWFAGRFSMPLAGLDPERGGLTECGYFCDFEALENLCNDTRASGALQNRAAQLIDYWTPRVTALHCREALSPRGRAEITEDDYYCGRETAYPFYGFGGPGLNFRHLMKRGLCGLKADAEHRLQETDMKEDGQVAFLQGCIRAVEIVIEIAGDYAVQARKMAGEQSELTIRERCLKIASSLSAIMKSAPSHYHEAVQLMWLYALASGSKNYGRLDSVLGDFLARDLETEFLTWSEAAEMTKGLWTLILARGNAFNNRIVIGGSGRPDPATADVFARLALQIQAETCQIIPQLSLRWHKGMDPELWNLSFEALRSGSTFPILYNDDINVPSLARGLRVTEAEAEQYVPYGCGEYVLEGLSTGSPDGALNLLKLLNITLANGVNPATGQQVCPQTGEFADFETFDALMAAFSAQIEQQIELLADFQETVYRVTGQTAAYPLLSLLYEDCLARALPLLAGGVRYLGGTVEVFGSNSASDALLAIRQLVYERHVFSQEELIKALKENFCGYEPMRKQLLNCPKFGNDNELADALSIRVNTVVCEAAQRQRERTGLHSFNVVLVNNGDNVTLGQGTRASADGRFAGTSVSNGNQPSIGADQNGLTALLNSMARLDPSLHAGATQAIKISKGLITRQNPQVSAMIKAYFSRGGAQIMLTIVDRTELEQAMQYPEQYRNLIVRVGGYSERFVDLPRSIQQEVLCRTLY